MLADSSKLWRVGAEMLSVVPRAGAWRGALPAGSASASVTACSQIHADSYFCFLPFFVKAKILLRSLSVSENRF